MCIRDSIPAHAGQPGQAFPDGCLAEAYPRSRGATVAAPCIAADARGLSPLTRGNPAWLSPAADMAGPIPAHAGQPQCPARSTPRTWAYPRSRGATRPVYLVYLNDEGLSPLTRGNHLRQRAGVFNPGPIPAHAGQPTRRFVAPMARWAYPRSRGATGSRGTVTLLSMGLSPLTRGNLLLPRFPCRAPGPIPAHAGQPPCWCQSCGTGGAYPRSRGATFSSTHTVRPFGGLSLSLIHISEPTRPY